LARGGDDQRIALSAILTLHQRRGQLEAETAQLRRRVAAWPVLVQDLEDYLSPPAESEEMRKHKELVEEDAKKRQERQARDKQSWNDFHADVLTNVTKLSDPACVKSWKAGMYRLGGLTKWLHHRTQGNEGRAIRQWRLLEEGFGRETAEAYRDGMKLLWRNVRPERPVRKEGSAITIKRATIFAFGALGLEAAEDPDWALRLSEKEAKRAILHACLSEQGCPDWLDDLIKSHPKVVLPIIKRSVKDEWLASNALRSDFLHQYARPAASIQPIIQKMLFEIDSGSTEPTDPSKLECASALSRTSR
jgi:hypothetical protein